MTLQQFMLLKITVQYFGQQKSSGKSNVLTDVTLATNLCTQATVVCRTPIAAK